jgi:uncharacterized protein YfdQ (DUF2303 family)
MDTEAEVISDLTRRAALPQTVETNDGRTFLVTPDDASIREISDEHGLHVTNPRYIKQAVTLQTQESLIAYVNRYKDDATVLFADIAANAILATIDYHEKNGASHVAHRALLTLPFSEEWRLWTEISGKLKPQLEFARFIEENGADVRAPDAADLLEAVRDLQAHRKVNFIKAVRTSSDNENFEFQDETKTTTRGGIELPTKFKLGLPVYFGEPDTEVFAFLRWKLDDGALTLGIALHRVEHVRQAVFKQIVDGVAAATGCPAMFGRI